MQKFNFSYDKRNDDLFLFSPKSKSKGSVELGGIILDYNSKKELVGLQLIGASKIIRELMGESESTIKGVLNSLKGCKVDIRRSSNMLFIKVHLLGRPKEIVPVISVPCLAESSPALAYA